jgi:hypothetical protein
MSTVDKPGADAAIAFAMRTLEQVPKDALESHLTAVLVVFWSSLWGSFGTEYARGFIERQLDGMQPDNEHETYIKPSVQ